MEYYNSDNELDYSWWHVDDYVIDEIIINNLNRKRKEAAYNMKLDWSKKLPDNGDMD